MGDWYDDAIIDEGNDAGAYTDNGEPKGLLHTTESKTYSSAKNSYIAKNTWPHMTGTYERGFFQVYQHNSIAVAARSLQNKSGGVETNRDRVFQIELVGSCDTANKSWGDQYVENFPKDYLDGIRKVMRWAERELLIPRLCTVTFKSYPDSYGNNGVRLSGPEFDAYSGWLGHQHAAENDHGDPGLIDIDYLLEDEDEMTPEDRKWIEDQFAAVLKQVNGLKPVIVARTEAVPGGPDPWYSIPAQTRSEETKDTATQAVNQGTARWWDPKNPGPVRIPSAVIDSLKLLDPDPLPVSDSDPS